MFSVDLANRGEFAMSDVTVDVVVPAETSVDRLDASLGQTTLVDSLARWHVPRLAAGGQATLKIRSTVRPIIPRYLELCVMLLSEGAPLEHCAAFETVAGPATPWQSEPADAPLLPTAERAASLNLDAGPGGVLGSALISLGLIAMVLWLGLQYLGARRSGEGGSEQG